MCCTAVFESPISPWGSVSYFPSSLSFRAVLICAWAEKGADAMGPDGAVVHSDAFPPEALVDTLGAGDTFNASVIFSLCNGEEAAAPSAPP